MTGYNSAMKQNRFDLRKALCIPLISPGRVENPVKHQIVK
jgi:hypothetical protein